MVLGEPGACELSVPMTDKDLPFTTLAPLPEPAFGTGTPGLDVARQPLFPGQFSDGLAASAPRATVLTPEAVVSFAAVGDLPLGHQIRNQPPPTLAGTSVPFDRTNLTPRTPAPARPYSSVTRRRWLSADETPAIVIEVSAGA